VLCLPETRNLGAEGRIVLHEGGPHEHGRGRVLQSFFHDKPSKSSAVEQREESDLSARCVNVVSPTEGRRWSGQLYHSLVALFRVAESWLPTHVM